jgi:coenzyme PQQ precursor peptide PqqA
MDELKVQLSTGGDHLLNHTSENLGSYIPIPWGLPMKSSWICPDFEEISLACEINSYAQAEL